MIRLPTQHHCPQKAKHARERNPPMCRYHGKYQNLHGDPHLPKADQQPVMSHADPVLFQGLFHCLCCCFALAHAAHDEAFEEVRARQRQERRHDKLGDGHLGPNAVGSEPLEEEDVVEYVAGDALVASSVEEEGEGALRIPFEGGGLR